MTAIQLFSIWRTPAPVFFKSIVSASALFTSCFAEVAIPAPASGQSEICFSIDTVPFSYRGSYLAISEDTTEQSDGIYLRHFTGLDERRLFKMVASPADENKKTVSQRSVATPSQLQIRNGEHLLSVCFENDRTLLFESETEFSFESDGIRDYFPIS